MHVPYTDYSLIPEDLKKDILLEIGRVMRFKNQGEHERYVAGVEIELARYFQAKFAIAVDSGTTALQLSLTALGVREGDEVLVPAYTYAATYLAVTNLGAKPVRVDVKTDDLTIDPDLIEGKITSRTKAVIPVHIHGFCCDMEKIRRICEQRKIALVEDASQAHGAHIKGKKAGTFGIAGCFSLHTSKNLGGIGDAGLIVLNDEALYRKIQEYLVPDSGTKAALESRRTPCTMDAIQAAIVRKKLPFLGSINERKRQIAGQYDACLTERDIKKPVPLQGSYAVYRDYFIIVDDPETLKASLLKESIETKLGYGGKVLLLPCFAGMTGEQLQYVCAVLREKYARA